MKNYISNITMLIAIAFTALVSVSLYYLNPESSALSSRDYTSLSGAAETNSAATSPLKNTAHEIPASEKTKGAETIDNQTGRKEQVDTPPDNDKEIAMLVQSNQAHLSERDLALPPPSSKNVMAEATGEYADQINSQVVFSKAKSEGYLPPEVAPDSHPPSGKNVVSEPQGEKANEVRQQALIDKAKSEGYLPPEVVPSSHPPSGKNVAAEPQGDNAHEITNKH